MNLLTLDIQQHKIKHVFKSTIYSYLNPSHLREPIAIIILLKKIMEATFFSG